MNNKGSGIPTLLAIIAIVLAIAFNIGLFKHDTVTEISGTVNNTEISSNTPTNNQSLSEQIQAAQNQADALQQQIDQVVADKTNSVYKDKIYISHVSRSSKYPNQEYVEIEARLSLTDTAIISGWTLKSAYTGESVRIPNSSILYIPGIDPSLTPITLQAGETVIVNSGTSPVGMSFRDNVCSGYIYQTYDFTPSSYGSCPDPSKETIPFAITPVEADCADYLERIGSCETIQSNIPLNFSSQCTEYILKRFNYKGCLDTYKNQPGFYTDIWRIFLNRSIPLWSENNHESLMLLDQYGKLVDTYDF